MLDLSEKKTDNLKLFFHVCTFFFFLIGMFEDRCSLVKMVESLNFTFSSQSDISSVQGKVQLLRQRMENVKENSIFRFVGTEEA